MSDTTLNQFISRGTNAQRVAFTPSPATPASGNNPSYIWYETDTANTYMWDGSAWQKVNTGSGGGGGGASGPIPVGLSWDTADADEPIIPIPGKFSPTLPGLVPPSGGGTTNFLRADGTWAAPSGGGGGGSPPSIVQVKCAGSASIQGVTLTSAPTAGNWLLAFVCGFSPSPGTGWTQLARLVGGSTFTLIFAKLAGSGESATQNCCGSAGNGVIAMYELSNSTITGITNESAGTATSQTMSLFVTNGNGWIIGVAMSESTTDLPSSYSAGITQDATALGSSKSIAAWHESSVTAGTANTVSVNWPSSLNTRFDAIFVGGV